MRHIKLHLIFFSIIGFSSISTGEIEKHEIGILEMPSELFHDMVFSHQLNTKKILELRHVNTFFENSITSNKKFIETLINGKLKSNLRDTIWLFDTNWLFDTAQDLPKLNYIQIKKINILEATIGPILGGLMAIKTINLPSVKTFFGDNTPRGSFGITLLGLAILALTSELSNKILERKQSILTVEECEQPLSPSFEKLPSLREMVVNRNQHEKDIIDLCGYLGKHSQFFTKIFNHTLLHVGTKIYGKIMNLKNDNISINTRFGNLNFRKVSLNKQITVVLRDTQINLFQYDPNSKFFCYYDYILDIYLPCSITINKDDFDHAKNNFINAVQELIKVIGEHKKILIKVRNRTIDNNFTKFNKLLLLFLGTLLSEFDTKKIHVVEETNTRFKCKINMFAKHASEETYLISKAFQEINPFGFSLNQKI